MQHPDEGTIHAWLDGALSPEEGAALEAHVASCPECPAAIAEARGLIAASSRIVSALDIVPGGVIPARKPVARPWYTSTQLRAAAAVLFIAGTSFVLYRNRDAESLSSVSQRVMSDQAAPVVAETESDAALKQSPAPEPAAATGAAANVAAPRTEPSTQRKTESLRTGSGVTGTVSAPAAEAAQSATDVSPPPAAPAPAPVAVSAPPPPAADTAGTVLASPIVVTGMAASDLSSDLRVLSVDSSGNSRTTRYRIASGAELTLVEVEPVSAKAVSARERRLDAARPTSAAPQLRQAAADSEAAIQTISWTDPQSQRTYTLSGRVSKETLEEVKGKLQRKP